MSKNFKLGDVVKDLKYPARCGGIVTRIYKYEILVLMTFEDEHKGYSSFKTETAEKELEIIETED